MIPAGSMERSTCPGRNLLIVQIVIATENKNDTVSVAPSGLVFSMIEIGVFVVLALASLYFE